MLIYLLILNGNNKKQNAAEAEKLNSSLSFSHYCDLPFPIMPKTDWGGDLENNTKNHLQFVSGLFLYRFLFYPSRRYTISADDYSHIKFMPNLIQLVLNSKEKSVFREFLHQLRQPEKGYWLRNDILVFFSEFCAQQQSLEKTLEADLKKSKLGKLLSFVQEIIIENESFYLVIRPKIAC